jgi:PAS domain S-box-containing protein
VGVVVVCVFVVAFVKWACRDSNQIRRALRDVANQKKALDEHAIVSITDVRGVILYVNDKFVEISGYRRDELLGQSHSMLRSDEHDRTFYDNLWEMIRNKRVWIGELKNIAKDGSHYWVVATIVPFTDEEGTITQYVSIQTDVSSRKQSEDELKVMIAELKLAREAAEAADQSKSQFLANMSHEIRTPMTAILGYAQTLAENIEGDENLEAIETVQRNGKYLLVIINDILDLSKIEAGKALVESIPHNPCLLVAEVVDLIKGRARAAGLRLEVEFVGEVPETIETDPTRMRQILINMIGNAIKFTEIGSVRLIVRFEGEGEAARLRFDVQDTGVGMSEDQVANLFQPFVQADNSTTRRFGGTGLGLTISKRFANLLGGDIELVESAVGVGSRFMATFPVGRLEGVEMLSDPGAVKVRAGRQGTGVRGEALAGSQILLAEDSPDNQRLIAFILKKAGAEVTVAENGRLAYDAAIASRHEGRVFDCILMDMQMPVMSGYEATAALREAGYAGSIIALTAHAMINDRQKCLDAGCDDFANKPIDRAELIGMIAGQIGLSAAAA